jgi:glycosyltransferase involved in cell wall biosynthesis
MTPLISVILPVYNGSKYLAKSIGSILEQTFSNFELIIVNDGSTDDSQLIIDSFDDNRIRVIQKVNSGLIDSLNIGISQSIGTWIARMDSDDISSRNRFEEQIKFFDDEVAVIGTQAFLIDSFDQIFGKTNLVTCHDEIVSELYNYVVNIVHPSVIINKALLLEVGGYDSKMYVAEDYDLWLRLSKIGKIINSNLYLISLRKHDENISLNNLNISVENSLISLFYNHNTSSYLKMSIDDYDRIKKLVSPFAEEYSRRAFTWEMNKLVFNSFSRVLRFIYLFFNLKILWNYFTLLCLKRNLVLKLFK